jgi:hypothetical protein
MVRAGEGVTTVKIFGREPAALVGVVQAALWVAVVFGLGVTDQQSLLLVAAAAAVLDMVAAWGTRDTMLGLVVGTSKALLAVAVGFGLDWSPDQQAAILALASVVVSLFQRTQTVPLEKGSFALAA